MLTAIWRKIVILLTRNVSKYLIGQLVQSCIPFLTIHLNVHALHCQNYSTEKGISLVKQGIISGGIGHISMFDILLVPLQIYNDSV